MAVVIMVDQSGSMWETIAWRDGWKPKCIAVAEIINNLLEEFVARSRCESGYKHYYDIMVVGYSGAGVQSLLADSNSYFVSPEKLVGIVKETQNVQRQRLMPDGKVAVTNVLQRVWVEATAHGRTPMRAAFSRVYGEIKDWCGEHYDSFPPLIINISDGEATDSTERELVEVVAQIKTLQTSDGEPIIMNIHLSGSSESSIIFPENESELPEDKYAHLLHSISSKMPDCFAREIAAHFDHPRVSEYRGMAFNASMADLVKFINIGSTTVYKL